MKKLLSALFMSSCLLATTAQANDVTFSVGLSATQGGYHAKGTERIGQEGSGSTGNAAVTEENGVFDDSHQSIFGELNIGDNMSVGVEFAFSDIQTPTNTNAQNDNDNGTAAVVENTAKASFSDLTTVYIQARMLGGLYTKIMYHNVNVISEESMGTGGAYGDATIEGLGAGIGYQHDFDDLGIFVRAEVTASAYEDVKAINTNDITKQITIDNMYGAEGSIRVGKTF